VALLPTAGVHVRGEPVQAWTEGFVPGLRQRGDARTYDGIEVRRRARLRSRCGMSIGSTRVPAEQRSEVVHRDGPLLWGSNIQIWPCDLRLRGWLLDTRNAVSGRGSVFVD
jgi:hypothetical protein